MEWIAGIIALIFLAIFGVYESNNKQKQKNKKLTPIRLKGGLYDLSRT